MLVFALYEALDAEEKVLRPAKSLDILLVDLAHDVPPWIKGSQIVSSCWSPQTNAIRIDCQTKTIFLDR